MPDHHRSKVIISPAGLSEQGRTDYVLSGLRTRLQCLTGGETNPERSGTFVSGEMRRLGRFFNALDGIANKQADEKVNSKWLFEFLLHHKRSVWISLCQGIENVVSREDDRLKQGHVAELTIPYMHDDGRGHLHETSFTFSSVKRFRDPYKEGPCYETFQTAARQLFQLRKSQDDAESAQIYHARFPVIFFDSRICQELAKYPSLQINGVPKVLLSCLAIFTLADHDYFHGVAIPWRNDAMRHMPDEFKNWQHEVLAGAPLLWEVMEGKPHISWTPNYEILSQRAAYEVFQTFNVGAAAHLLETGLKEMGNFKEVSLAAASNDKALNAVEISRMCRHLVTNMARFAAHVIPYDQLEPVLEKHGYGDIKRTNFGQAVQRYDYIPLGDSGSPDIPYVHTLNEVRGLYNIEQVRSDLRTGDWRERVAEDRRKAGLQLNNEELGGVKDFMRGFYTAARKYDKEAGKTR